jgi:nicotinamidase-related amidase
MSNSSQPSAIPGDFTQTVLLIIDVQRSLFEQANPMYREDRLIENLNTLADQAHTCGVPVVYIQHCDDDLVIDTPGWQLHAGLHPLETDTFVRKHECNSFQDTPLAAILNEKKVGKVIVTGCVTNYCVQSTCRGALALGYPTVLVTDAHSNDSPDAAAVIREWNDKLGIEGAVLLSTAQVRFDN